MLFLSRKHRPGQHYTEFNLKIDYPGRFLHLSILLISDHTLRLLGKMVKRKLQEGRLHRHCLGCLKNGQADPTRITKGYATD